MILGLSYVGVEFIVGTLPLWPSYHSFKRKQRLSLINASRIIVPTVKPWNDWNWRDKFQNNQWQWAQFDQWEIRSKFAHNSSIEWSETQNFKWKTIEDSNPMFNSSQQKSVQQVIIFCLVWDLELYCQKFQRCTKFLKEELMKWTTNRSHFSYMK